MRQTHSGKGLNLLTTNKSIMKFTPEQAKQINEASYNIQKQHYELLEVLITVDRDLARQYYKSMTKLTLPYIDESGTLLHLCLPEVGNRYEISKISPEMARRIASHRPEIEAMLEGKVEEKPWLGERSIA